ncbi:MAG: hypothetical protein GF308_03035 [Candidatus Heimdallarchaeota archaeon]|nr:hypothetical protein [Candidatus Heimdallarchaeota archaeon]
MPRTSQWPMERAQQVPIPSEVPTSMITTGLMGSQGINSSSKSMAPMISWYAW